MKIFFIFIFTLAFAFTVVSAIVVGVANALPRLRNLICVFLSCGASFALSFSADFWFQILWGKLTYQNAVLPIFTWLAIAIFCQVQAISIRRARWPVFTPYLGGACLAFLGGAVAFDHMGIDFAVGAVLLTVGLLLLLVISKSP